MEISETGLFALAFQGIMNSKFNESLFTPSNISVSCCVSLTRYIFTSRTKKSRRTTAVETIESINAGSTMQTWIILAVVDVCRKGIKALNLLQNSSSAALVVPIRIGKSILVVRKSYAVTRECTESLISGLEREPL